MAAAGANGQFGLGDPHPASSGSQAGGAGEGGPRGGDPAASPVASPAAQRPLVAASGGSLAELRRERLRLAEQVASLTWDLGGLAYEMAIRDHYRLDVLARRAAELQQADAQLGEVERLLASADGGIGGACRACGAAHSRGAAYCWRCGSPLLLEGRPSVLPEPAGTSD